MSSPPTSFMASARILGASALSLWQSAVSVSALSTLVYAAQFTMHCTSLAFTASMTAFLSVMSRIVVSTPSASTTSVKMKVWSMSFAIMRISLPSWPFAPVTSIFIVDYSLIAFMNVELSYILL